MARVLFPTFLDLTGRDVLVVGGGNVATQKAERLAAAGARIIVVSPAVTPSLAQLAVEVRRRPFAPDDLAGVWYVVSAAPPAVNHDVVREAHARRVFVNAVDDPANATAFAGSTFSRGPVTVSISTAGEAPALARLMREALERLIGDNVQDWVALAAKLRGDWKRGGVPMDRRRDALLESMTELHREHAPTQTSRPRVSGGFVSLVGAGPGDPELLTRIAVRRLAEADLVLYDALVAPATVSLALRAQRIMVGRRRGSETLGQEAIIRTLIRAARRGRRVVRLKGGDPFVFGRGGEEALALAGAGIAFEIVPGISNALAAPALASIPVTHRGVSQSVLITSGHDVEKFQTLVNNTAPGMATLVILMGTLNRGMLADALLDAGWPGLTPAAVVWNASGRDQRIWSGPLDAVPDVRQEDDAPGTIVVGEVVAIRDALTATVHQPQTEVRHA